MLAFTTAAAFFSTCFIMVECMGAKAADGTGADRITRQPNPVHIEFCGFTWRRDDLVLFGGYRGRRLIENSQLRFKIQNQRQLALNLLSPKILIILL